MKLKAAIKYQEMGFSVIPIKPDKKPYLMTWAEYQKTKPTKDSLKKWWNTWPDANPAIVTGEISNLVVVDVDSAQGFDDLNKLIPETLTTPIARSRAGDGIIILHIETVCQTRREFSAIAIFAQMAVI